MSTLYFGVYTLTIAIIWGIFIILRLHAIKFNNFQTSIQKYIKILFFLLLVLSIIGYVIIFMMIRSGGISEINFLKDSFSKDSIQEKVIESEQIYY